MNGIILIIFALLMLPGLFGVFLPILPSIPYMFIIALIYAIIGKFDILTGNELAILGAIALASLVVDYFSGILGAKFGGASKQAMLSGLIGFLVGLVILPPFGGIFGLVVGVLFAELRQHGDRQRAIKAATGSLIGTLSGMLVNFILALTFLVLFIVFAK